MTKQITHSKRLILSFWNKKMKLLVVAVALLTGGMQAQTVVYLNSGSGTFNVPSGVVSMTVECWGGGGAGGSVLAEYNSTTYKPVVRGGGGNGGSYSSTTITNPSASYVYVIGAGGTAYTQNVNIFGTATNGANTTFGPAGLTQIIATGGNTAAGTKVTNTNNSIYGSGAGTVSTGNQGNTDFYALAGADAISSSSGAGAYSAGASGSTGGIAGAAGISSDGYNNGNTGAIGGAGGSGASMRITGTNITGNKFNSGGSGGSGRIKISYYYPSDLVAPVNKFVATSGSNVTITAIATLASPRTVSSVVFKDGSTTILGTVTPSGNNYSIEYVTPTDGTHLITAIITDDQATVYTSPVRTIYVGTYTGNKYAKSDITWATGPWYNDALDGVVVDAPGIGDNVFTQNKLITIGADAVCDNLTIGITSGTAANKININGAYTLTVRGLIDCPQNADVDIFGTSNIGSTIKLTGEAIPTGTGPFTLISDWAIRSIRPKNLLIDLQDTRAYQMPATATGTVNTANGAHGDATTCGKLTVAKGNIDIKAATMIGQSATSELIVAAGATLSLRNLRASLNTNPAVVGTKATINGTLISTGVFSVKELVLGANATFKTNQATRTTFQTWDGWWGNGTTVTTPAYGEFATPTSVTLDPNSTIEFNNAGNQNINGIVPENKMYIAAATPTLAATVTPTFSINYTNLKLSGSGTKTVRSDLTVSKSLDVETGVTMVIPTGVTLNIAAGAKLTNSGTITNNGTINFLSDATNGTATYIGGAIGGTVYVNQSLQHSGARRTWYVSSPVSGTFTPDPLLFPTIKTFNETDNAWSDPLAVMEAKKGYLVVPALAANDLLFTGTLNTGNQNISITGRDGVGANQGFNLVGNPYPSYIDWKSVYDYTTDAGATFPNRTALRSSTMWYRTKQLNLSNELEYQFWAVNGDGVGAPTIASKYIPPMQAFWVRSAVTKESTTKTLVLTDAMRAHAPATNKLLKAPAAKNLERTLVRLEVSNGVNTDEAVIYFSENAQNGLDRLDAPKMNNDNSAIPEIHTILGNEKIVINAMNSIPMDTPIGLGFVAGNATSFSLRANEISNLPEGVKLMLRDNVTYAETDLTDGVSSYTFAPEETSIDRFSVIFRSAGVATGINNAINTNLSAYYNNSKITVLCGDDKLIGSELSVYNAVGQKIVSKQLMGSKMQVEGLFVPGVYILKANNTTTKVIVK